MIEFIKYPIGISFNKNSLCWEVIREESFGFLMLGSYENKRKAKKQAKKFLDIKRGDG